MLVTRIAPTPSGFLHLGNGFSFALTWLLAKTNSGKIWLRIDDLDKARFRENYLEDIFQTLDWLKIDWDFGPRDPKDFLENHSQSLRLDSYFSVIDKLKPKSFWCSCSRNHTFTNQMGQHLCHDMVPSPPSAMKIKNPENPISFYDLKAGTQTVDLREQMSEFVLLTKEGLPSYQVASLCDDWEMGVNLIVRGKDLTASTAAQIYLSSILNDPKFENNLFLHHNLLMGSNGQKLSKSSGSMSMAHMRKNGIRVKEIVGHFTNWLNLNEKANKFEELIGHPIFDLKPILANRHSHFSKG